MVHEEDVPFVGAATKSLPFLVSSGYINSQASCSFNQYINTFVQSTPCVCPQPNKVCKYRDFYIFLTESTYKTRFVSKKC